MWALQEPATYRMLGCPAQEKTHVLGVQAPVEQTDIPYLLSKCCRCKVEVIT
jgi:hypothetical protein